MQHSASLAHVAEHSREFSSARTVCCISYFSWTARNNWRLARPRRLQAFGGEPIEVASTALGLVETALAETMRVEQMPSARHPRYWAIAQAADEVFPWHIVGGVTMELVVRAQTEPTAVRLTDLINRLAEAEVRTPQGPGYWTRRM